FAVMNLAIILTIYRMLKKVESVAMPTEIVFIMPSVTDTFTPRPSATMTASPTATNTITATIVLTASSSPTSTATVIATDTIIANIPTISLSPTETEIANIPTAFLHQSAVSVPTQAPVSRIIPLVVVNPLEAFPTYATVPAGGEEFAQAAFRFVYGQRQIR